MQFLTVSMAVREGAEFFEEGLGRLSTDARKANQSTQLPSTTHSSRPSRRATEGLRLASTGWETMLEGLCQPVFRSPELGRCEQNGQGASSASAQCPGLFRRAGVPPASRRSATRHTAGVRAGAQARAAGRPLGDDGREHRPGGPGAGHHRAWDGDLLPLLKGRGGRRLADAGPHGAPDHQPGPSTSTSPRPRAT